MMPEPQTLPGSNVPSLVAKLAELAALVDVAGGVADRGLCLLRIGEASYALFTSIADPRLWDAPLRFAYGALNEALQHPAIAALEDAGLVDVSGALLRTELLLDELEEPASAEQAELAARLS